MQHKPKKSLGQNFLKSEPALKKIIEAGDVKREDLILEIGPGKGRLTEKLLQKAGTVVAVEKDRNLFDFLKSKFEKEIEENSLVLIEGDILEFNPEEILKSKNLDSYKIIANIPYNITGAILKKFLTKTKQPERMILMVQKEVAERIMGRSSSPSKNAKESILSVSVKAYGEPKVVMKVPARYFSPSPKVDSAVISIKNISRKLFTETLEDSSSGQRVKSTKEESFWEIVRAGFAHKRKKLSSNLKNLKIEEENPHLKALGNKRAEELLLADWIQLAKTLNINKKE